VQLLPIATQSLRHPPTVQPAPQPEVTSLTGVPLVQANPVGNHFFLAYNAVAGGPFGTWSATTPNQFTTSLAKASAVDLSASADDTFFASRTSTATEIRGADLTLTASPASPELEQIPGRVLVPGLAMHPTGALLYQPFLTGPAPAAPPTTGIQGGVDVLDSRTGLLRLRVFLPEPFATLATDLDALHGSFLAVDETGQRLFALTTSGLTVVLLAIVPRSPSAQFLPHPPRRQVEQHSPFAAAVFNREQRLLSVGKTSAVAFVDINTLTVVTPAVTPGAQRITITNANGDTYTLDAAFTAN
jgi:hypothetical protein